ncbi:MAG: hypothetical protein ACYDCK_13320 [Thermoplasmatota archaeon]
MAAETSAQLIFFIAASVLAAGVSAILTGAVTHTAGKIEERSAAMGSALTTQIVVVNDPSDVPNNPVLLYVKNVGTTSLNESLLTVVVDGTPRTFTVSLLGGATRWGEGDVAEYSIAVTLAAGDHQARVTTENGVSADLRFRE